MTPEDLYSIRVNLLGLGVEEFASLLGVHRRTVYCWETGRNEIPGSVSLLLTFARAVPEVRQMLLERVRRHALNQA